ncbi:hypothetical protein E1189_07880, partial [Sansalvadorimonas verongulae]|nr:hypothetical protein [Sansalvadorimonas verongulae]
EPEPEPEPEPTSASALSFKQFTIPALSLLGQYAYPPPLPTKNTRNHRKYLLTEGCNCKKTECAKNYCRCYSNRQHCTEQCKCTDCKNTFDSSSGQSSAAPYWERIEVLPNGSRIQKNGCYCKKGCDKRYCQCRLMGLICSNRCHGNTPCHNKVLDRTFAPVQPVAICKIETDRWATNALQFTKLIGMTQQQFNDLLQDK